MNRNYKPLSESEIESFAEEIEQLKVAVKKRIGSADARYIRNVHRAVRYSGVLGRGVLFLSFIPWLWFVGVALLALSKILDNMELGHNVIHGQFDFMGDPHYQGKNFEWDIVATSENWRETHNFKHHTYTNIEGHDEDIGYGFIRMFAEQPWSKWNLLQPLYTVAFAFVFQWGVALQNVRFTKLAGKGWLSSLLQNNRDEWKKVRWQVIKDYIVFPIIAGPMFLYVLAGNALANVIRSLWTFTIIFCGHFTDKVIMFPADTINETRSGHWYLRQIQGSSNISGGKWFHILSGNLSHQIEHHLFPEIPANRYAELAPHVEDICKRYGQTYNTGRLSQQFSQVWFRIFRHAFPSEISRC
jgi:fatty acid desaturase